MRKAGIIVLVIIGGVIAAYAGLQVNPADTAPQIIDTPIIVEDVEISLKELQTIEEEDSQINDEGFYIDEDGVKHYVISAVDTPKVGD